MSRTTKKERDNFLGTVKTMHDPTGKIAPFVLRLMDDAARAERFESADLALKHGDGELTVLADTLASVSRLEEEMGRLHEQIKCSAADEDNGCSWSGDDLRAMLEREEDT